MRKRHFRHKRIKNRLFLGLLATALIALLLLSPWVQKGAAEENAATEADILAGAQNRIEQYRKSDTLVRVLSSTGEPVTSAIVHVEQLRHAFLFGSNPTKLLRYKDPKQEAMYEQAFSDLFNYATLPFYWQEYEPQQGQRNYTLQEKQARWLVAHNITPKGHPVVWHWDLPKWVSSNVNVAKQQIYEHVTYILTRFKGLIDYWDVFNEALKATEKIDNGESRWIKRDGVARVVGDVLERAHKANPQASLVYNDYYLSQSKYEQLAQELIASKRPVDAFGIQTHMQKQEVPISQVWEICERYSRFGKPLHFSELSIISGQHGSHLPLPWPSTPEGETAQADYAEKLYTVLFSHPAVEAITWWDITDPGWQGAPAGLLHKDLTPKPVYLRLMKLIKGDWWTQTDLQTDDEGKTFFRGFLGHYQITVTTSTGTTTQEVDLESSKPTTIEIHLP